ncbi:putative MFS transporter superfamily [Septoria linicola]|nr:putative MFS transporter superfamily [Septoria linicola]
MWEIVACGAAALVMLLFLLSETYLPKIVKDDLESATSATHGQNADTKIGTAIFNALLKPLQISVLDPAIMYVNIYTSYLYACYYTFFDGFPMVHHITYKFTREQIGLGFLPIRVGCAVAG